jgi:hypothetical protein
MNKSLKTLWKYIAVAQFEVIFQNVSGDTGATHNKLGFIIQDN